MSSNPTQISLYADEKQLLEREVEVSNQGLTRADGSDLISYYELDYVLHWIIENNYKHVRIAPSYFCVSLRGLLRILTQNLHRSGGSSIS